MKVISDSYDLNNKVTSLHTFLTRTEFFFPAKNANKSLLLPSLLYKNRKHRWNNNRFLSNVQTVYHLDNLFEIIIDVGVKISISNSYEFNNKITLSPRIFNSNQRIPSRIFLSP